MTIDLFVSYYIDQFYPDTAFNAIKVLESCGLDVNYNPEQSSCGREFYEAGYFDDAKELGENFMNDFSGDNPIVGLSTASVSHIQMNFEKLFYNSGSHLQYKKVKNNIYDFSDFIVNNINKLDFNAELAARVSFHDSSYALRKYKTVLKQEPRKLLQQVKGLELIEIDNNEGCGFGGIFSLKYSAISTAMVEKIIRSALDKNVEYIICSEPTCLINLSGYIRKFNLPIKTLHIADVLARAL